MNTDVLVNIGFFFTNPLEPPAIPGEFSQLYLLRRDIFICYGIDPTTMVSLPAKALWPGVMGICAGIDLLAKFLAGEDSNGGVGSRFKKFLTEYFDLNDHQAEVIYQLRNSLLHSFGLYSEVTRGNLTTIYRFALSPNSGTLLKSLDGDTYLVNIGTFRRQFERAVVKYEGRVISDQVLQINFSKMFSKHSAVSIG